ncbi:MAG: hypothetical protein AAFY56_03160 [Pseudomonadota bacterium]
MSFKYVLPVALMIILGSCATEQRYSEILDAWVGSTERELVESWGPPDSVYTLEDTKYLTYRAGRTVIVPGFPARYRDTIDGDRVYSTPYGATAPTIINQFCKTSFTIEDSTVTEWRAEGNDCRA